MAKNNTTNNQKDEVNTVPNFGDISEKIDAEIKAAVGDITAKLKAEIGDVTANLEAKMGDMEIHINPSIKIEVNPTITIGDINISNCNNRNNISEISELMKVILNR